MNAFVDTAMPIDPCPVCGLPLHTYTQPGLLPTQPALELAECRNPNGCALFYVTLTRGEHARLTKREIDHYVQGRTVRKAQG